MINKITGNAPVPAPANAQKIETDQGSPLLTPEVQAARLAPVVSPDRVERVFERTQGRERNFYVLSPVAQAQVVVDNSPLNRALIVAQPSGNVGLGLWWSSAEVGNLSARGQPRAVEEDGFRGVQVNVVADRAGTLDLGWPMLDSVRAIREIVEIDPANTDLLAARERGEPPITNARELVRREGADRGIVPEASVTAAVVSELSDPPRRLVLARKSISGSHEHRLIVEAVGGTELRVDHGHVVAVSEGAPQISVTYLTNLPALTPQAPLDLLAPAVRTRIEKGVAAQAIGTKADSQLPALLRAAEDLSFLILDDKAMAGGWRFLTYFGRDTLLTARMMQPFLAPAAVRAILTSALGAVNDEGVVAHEPEEADQAEHHHLCSALAGEPTPARASWSHTVYDYKMVDDDFLLASLASEHLGRVDESEARTLLEAVNARGETNLRSLGRNLVRVAEQAKPYADSVARGAPDPTLLVRIPHGEQVGDWRDSNAGLGTGVYPASVNLELVPTTLRKAAALVRELEAMGYPVEEWAPDLAGADLSELAGSWEAAREHFQIELSAAEVLERLVTRLRACQSPTERTYFESLEIAPGVTVGDAVARGQLPFADVRFSALSLDDEGRPIPVMHSDRVFGLIGNEVREEAVRELVRLVTTPYPLGLATESGMLIANAALSNDPEQFERMGAGAYHGELYWTWPPAHVLAGLSSQREAARASGRRDLIALIDRGIAQVKKLVRSCSKPELLSTELYSSRLRDGPDGVEREPVPYAPPGQKANSTQLWTTALPFWLWA